MTSDWLEDKNRRTLTSAQSAYDNAEPPDPHEGIPMRCVQCGHFFDQSEAESLEDGGFMCPACGDNDTQEDDPEEPPEPDEPYDDIDEAAAFGGRDYP